MAKLDTFDKSNATLHIATGSMDFYNANKPFAWTIDEIAIYAKSNSYFLVAAQDRLFPGIEKTGMVVTTYKEELNYASKQTGGNLTNALNYTNNT